MQQYCFLVTPSPSYTTTTTTTTTATATNITFSAKEGYLVHFNPTLIILDSLKGLAKGPLPTGVVVVVVVVVVVSKPEYPEKPPDSKPQK